MLWFYKNLFQKTVWKISGSPEVVNSFHKLLRAATVLQYSVDARISTKPELDFSLEVRK